MLDSVVVVARRSPASVVRMQSGAISLRMDALAKLPQILGAADPIHYAQMLPGVQINSEYESGTHIQGCENSHNFLSIDGVAVYNANHFLGFFSTFNPTHFQSFELHKSPSVGEAPNRIGGLLNVTLPATVSDSLKVDFSVGLISSQATAEIPLNKKTSIRLSGRLSYINLLYSNWLKSDGNTIKYGFYDINATAVHRLSDQDALLLNFYVGADHAKQEQGTSRYLSDVSDGWGNIIGSAKWQHRGYDMTLLTTVYATSSTNKFRITMPDFRFNLPSSISEYGAMTSGAIDRWNFGGKIAYYSIKPQTPSLVSDLTSYDDLSYDTRNAEISAFGNYTLPLSMQQSVSIGASGAMFYSKTRTFYAIDPSVAWHFVTNKITIAAEYAIRHQYLFQAGFAGLGLPTEYWFASDKNYPAQWAHNCSASASWKLPVYGLELSAEAYYKKLYNQVEYSGSVLDFTNQEYNPLEHLISGHGYNYGINVMLNRSVGALVGWVSYSYSRAIRYFQALSSTKSFPANHDRPHEVNAVLTYKLNNHWSVGGTYVYASGYPFTAPKSFYMMNGSIISEFNEHNANRLKAYSKLDVSVNYQWHSRLFKQQGVNLSIYNVLCRKNTLYYRLKTYKTGEFAYKQVSFVLPFLPSISYYANF